MATGRTGCPHRAVGPHQAAYQHRAAALVPSVRRSHGAQANRRSTNCATDQTVDGQSADVRRTGRAHRSGIELLTRLQRQKRSNLLVEVDLALDLKREIDPAECHRRLCRELSFPLSLPSAKPCRTAFSISRWAVTPNLLRNLRLLALKTSSFIVASMLHFAAGLQQHSNEAPYLTAMALYNNLYS